MHTFDELVELTESSVERLYFPAEPSQLYAPIRYTLESGGKRIRPLIALASCEMFNDDATIATNIAMGIEVFHNFTLLHDDIMDNADIRRGRATVHKKWDENTAILSGDAMVIYSYELIAKYHLEVLGKILEVFNEIAMGVCQGQQYDMDFETSGNVTISQYLEMIRLKTAVLLAGAAKMGAIAGGATDADAQKIYNFGMALGISFQLQDDLLDTYGDPATFGKNIGGDIDCSKKTFLLLTAIEKAEDKDREKLAMLTSGKEYDKKEKFEAVRDIYDRYCVREITESVINNYHAQAVAVLNSINIPDSKKQTMHEVIKVLIKRDK